MMYRETAMTESEIKALIRKERLRSLGISFAMTMLAASLATSISYFYWSDQSIGPKAEKKLAKSETLAETNTPQPGLGSSISRNSPTSDRTIVTGEMQTIEAPLTNRSDPMLTPKKAIANNRVVIQVTELSWLRTDKGYRPRAIGKIQLPNDVDSSFQVEFWATAILGNEAIGYDNLRVTVSKGQGEFDETFFLQQEGATFNDQPPFELSIENLVILEAPQYEVILLNDKGDPAPIKQARSSVTEKHH